MDLPQANEILKNFVVEDRGLYYQESCYVDWDPSEATITLDGQYSPDELEAMAWWMREHQNRKDREHGGK